MRFTMLFLVALSFGCGASVQESEGSQAKVGEVCGGIAGILCEGDLWCDPDPGTCGVADGQGLCVEVQDKCTEDYVPVCGCDGTTYGNNCERIRAKVAKDHDGECEPREEG